MQNKAVTHTAKFSTTALEQLVTQAVASHVTRFQCVQLLFVLATNRLYSNNQHCMHKYKDYIQK